MIITVTLNPAVDRIVMLAELNLGDTNRISDGTFSPGGKGVNVSRMLRELGAPSLATGFLGGSLGEAITSSLKQSGIREDFIKVVGQTRLNLSIVETRWQRHTTLSETGPYVEPSCVNRLQRRLAKHARSGDWVVLAGSVPPGIPPDVYARLTVQSRRIGALVCLDADGDPLALGVAATPHLIKPNLDELQRLVGRPLKTDHEVVAAAVEIQRSGIRYVVVSLGNRGAIAVSPEGSWRSTPPAVQTVSALGSGDSLVAGIVLALSHGESLAWGLRIGTAAGAATAMQAGTDLGSTIDVLALIPQVTVEPLTLRRAA
jgi:1-phosphofructokinase family hexose kinase